VECCTSSWACHAAHAVLPPQLLRLPPPPPTHTDAFTIGAVTMGLTALPGFDGDQPQPQVALWRAVNTVLGVALEVAAVSLILPVTARLGVHGGLQEAQRKSCLLHPSIVPLYQHPRPPPAAPPPQQVLHAPHAGGPSAT
jgi:hypothetical protein